MDPNQPNRTRSYRFRPQRPVILADGLMLAWTAGWIYVAVRVGLDVHSLSQLPSTLGAAGHAIATTGGAIATLGHVPLVGGGLANLGHHVTATGRRAEVSAADSQGSISQLSVLLPIAVALLPVVPVLAVYLPLRIQRMREARAVIGALKAGEGQRVRTFLAHRAVTTLAFHKLTAVSEDPWLELNSERYDALAEAELQRLGIDVSAPSPPPR